MDTWACICLYSLITKYSLIQVQLSKLENVNIYFSFIFIPSRLSDSASMALSVIIRLLSCISLITNGLVMERAPFGNTRSPLIRGALVRKDNIVPGVVYGIALG